MLYMLANHTINFQNGEHLYFIKIGYTSKTLTERMHAYKTSNPMAMLIATRQGDKAHEKACHEQMMSKFNASKFFGEWFTVTEEQFNYFVENGFKAFRKNGKSKAIYKEVRTA